ncbi:MAG TPA: hypothetical protein VLN73_01095, partial [Alphaproteobacteria bacterium]|nr:hypothetical protein [Alphaproteobacteria bacterium]
MCIGFAFDVNGRGVFTLRGLRRGAADLNSPRLIFGFGSGERLRTDFGLGLGFGFDLGRGVGHVAACFRVRLDAGGGGGGNRIAATADMRRSDFGVGSALARSSDWLKVLGFSGGWGRSKR